MIGANSYGSNSFSESDVIASKAVIGIGGFGLLVGGIFYWANEETEARLIPNNVEQNNRTRDRFEKEYRVLYDRWQVDIDKENVMIGQENDRIKSFNASLGEPKVTYLH